MMKKLLTTVAISAALAFPALAEGTIGGEEALGEADGSFKHSADPGEILAMNSFGERAMAQAAPRRQIKSEGSKARAEAKVEAKEMNGFSAESLKSPTGMDGGNRK
jgi:hypothetical protein